MRWFWGEATPRNSKRCLRAVAPETMPTRFSEAFDCGTESARHRKRRHRRQFAESPSPGPSHKFTPNEKLGAKPSCPTTESRLTPSLDRRTSPSGPRHHPLGMGLRVATSVQAESVLRSGTHADFRTWLRSRAALANNLRQRLLERSGSGKSLSACRLRSSMSHRPSYLR